MKNRKTIVALLLVAIVGLVGLTIAYFANSQTINNLFSTKEYGTTYIEEFVSPSNWLPGDTTAKVVTATNSGEVDEAVRISYVEEWIPNDANATLTGWIHADGTKSNHTTETELSTDVRAAVINLANSSDWTKVGNYYYYNYKLAPEETTSSFIESVTFNPLTKLGDICTETESNGTKTINCNSSGKDYDNATYKLTLTIETVQYNKYNEAWNLGNTITILEENPLNQTGAQFLINNVVNDKSKTFENGDKTAMFEFSHSATEQTPALIDYRYIGHMPNNYLYFNCDDLNNQTASTCEVWRIIGVFDVDDGTGNYEQRIKIVRGSAFSEAMTWDGIDSPTYTPKNDWLNSTLKSYLNEDYYNNWLKESTREMIDDSKYYLGGIYGPGMGGGNNVFYNYGSTEEIYSIERGNYVYNPEEDTYNCNNNVSEDGICSTRSLDWNGKIAIMYPSDMYMTYAKGVDDECYNNPNSCYFFEATPSNDGIYNYPEASWIYNSNNLEGQASSYHTWLLTPQTNSYLYALSACESGRLGCQISFVIKKPYTNFYYSTERVSSPLAIRPVLYLSSNVKITDGTGEQNNPYKLGL